jgi:uncharacterized protein YodC (DUF2158 family)
MSALKSGDLVVLKSGGPVMTVDTVNTDIFDDNKVTGVLCAWFVGNKLERARFDRNAIVPAPPQHTPVDRMEPPAEASRDYKAVLDDMVAAMDAVDEAPDATSAASAERTKRTSRKYTSEAAAPAARSAN